MFHVESEVPLTARGRIQLSTTFLLVYNQFVFLFLSVAGGEEKSG
jgi:hypothetical protein